MKDVFEATQEAREKDLLKATPRKKLLKAVESFLKTEMILASDPNDNTEKMRKRVNYFAEKITEMKKDLK